MKRLRPHPHKHSDLLLIVQKGARHLVKLQERLKASLQAVKAVWLDARGARADLQELKWKALKRHPINHWVVLQEKQLAHEWTQSKYMCVASGMLLLLMLLCIAR
jgi:hypothetical protein